MAEVSAAVSNFFTGNDSALFVLPSASKGLTLPLAAPAAEFLPLAEIFALLPIVLARLPVGLVDLQIDLLDLSGFLTTLAAVLLPPAAVTAGLEIVFVQLAFVFKLSINDLIRLPRPMTALTSGLLKLALAMLIVPSGKDSL